MPKINLLPREISELIAAGEVVERPASVVKELVENSIDAGSTRITVEINRGGITYIRITDNGCGIASTDVPTAFLRHATSKIKTQSDLEIISTLGFRGEALAATCAVSKMEMFTKTKEEDIGTHYTVEGGEEISFEEAGCPDGTTVIVRDIFYNTPARMKFLKKDVTEGNAVSAVVERAALSHPEISFKLIRDGKQTVVTSGNGELKSAIYSILGREFSNSLIPVEGETGGISVSGYACKPVACKATRNGQYTFLNGRLVRSNTVMAAVEQSYKNSAMIGKFPAFVLNLKVPFEAVDVNVHPAKTEVRFADEKRIFDAVYIAVKNALSAGDTRPEIELARKSTNQFFEHISASQYRQQGMKMPQTSAESTTEPQRGKMVTRDDGIPFFASEDVKEFKEKLMRDTAGEQTKSPETPIPVKAQTPEIKGEAEEKTQEVEYSPNTEVRYIGEAFASYIVVTHGDSIFLIDKHAAHERINYNELKKSVEIRTQALLIPVTVRLSDTEYSALISNTDLMLKAGFEIEDFGNSTVIVRAVPSVLSGVDIEGAVLQAAENLAEKGLVEIEMLDRIYYTVACKAAIKAGYITSPAELLSLARRVLQNDDIRYCPHGRPVAFEITRRELEKQFGRIQ